MGRRWLSVIAALAITATFACDRTSSVTAPATDATARPNLDLSVTGYRAPGGYTLLAGSPADAVRSQSAVVGPQGGFIAVGANYLLVPPGAVTEPVVISVAVSGQPYISVNLQARTVVSREPVTQFARALTLRVSYATSQTPIPDPGHLKVFWVADGVVLGAQPTTVDTRTRALYAQLTHFSDYSPGLDP
jgi:hypothetical protein